MDRRLVVIGIILLGILTLAVFQACGGPDLFMDIQRIVEEANMEQGEGGGGGGLSAGDSDTRTANLVSFDMHYVPSGGPFTMGEHVETTTQSVTLTKNFWMGRTEVTQGLWEDVWGYHLAGRSWRCPFIRLWIRSRVSRLFSELV